MSKLLESSDKAQKELLAAAILDKAKASFDAADLTDARSLLVLEFDIKLALIAVRDFNISCKKRTTASCEFAVNVANAVRARLADLVGQYKDFKPTMSQEALKTLDKEDKDKLTLEFSLRAIMMAALQLVLHFVLVTCAKTSQALRKVDKEPVENKPAIKQALNAKLAERFTRHIRPSAVFDLIKPIVEAPHHSKAELDLALLIAIKLFSFPMSSGPDVMSQKESAL